MFVYWEPVQRKGKRIISVVFLLIAVGIFWFGNWIAEAIEMAHVMPEVERCDITGLFKKQTLTARDCKIISEQTGIGESIVEKMWGQDRKDVLLAIQDVYFAPVNVKEVHTTPITVSEWLEKGLDGENKGMPLVDIKDGDILITKNSRFLGWRNGHVGMVVDSEKGLVLEAVMIGADSQFCNISKWESYPSFMVLRLKAVDGVEVRESAETTNNTVDIPAEVAEYATEYLVGVPYRLLAGFAKSAGAGSAVDLKGTHCAHLIWYAYMQAGIDLDSDGGIFVTPNDIQNSPCLEAVQVYGY